MKIGQTQKSGNTKLSRGLWKLTAVATTTPTPGSYVGDFDEKAGSSARRKTTRGMYVTPAGVAKISRQGGAA